MVCLFCFLFLIEPLPDLEELKRFPNKESVEASIQLGEQHYDWCYKCYMTPPTPAPLDPYWRMRMGCAQNSLAPWKLLLEIHNGSKSEEVRRELLFELCKKVGKERFYSGCLPLPIPLELFAPKD